MIRSRGLGGISLWCSAAVGRAALGSWLLSLTLSELRHSTKISYNLRCFMVLVIKRLNAIHGISDPQTDYKGSKKTTEI